MRSASVWCVTDRGPGIAALAGRIPFLLSQLGAQQADDFQRRLAPLGVDPRTYAVLSTLAAADGRSQRELSAQLGIHRNVMVTVIDTLESQGLVQRLPHPADRRAFAVTLTDMARELLPALDEQARALEDEITAPLSKAERAALLKALQRISAAAGLVPGVHPGLS
jgi:DNA-binding MarR family transcriptional regulator